METKNYLLYDRIFSQRDEKEADFEEALPEYLPGIDRIVFAKAIPVVRYERFDEGKLQLGVRTVFKVMFVSDYKKQLKCTTFAKDTDFSFDVRATTVQGGETRGVAGCIPDCSVLCTFISAKPAGSRHINIRAKICANAAAYSPVYEALPTFCTRGDEGIVCLEKTIPTIVVSKGEGEEVRITKELTLEQEMPSIAEIVDASVEMCVGGVRHDESDRASVSGNAVFRALYRTEDDTYVTLIQEFPYTSEIAVHDDGENCNACAYKVNVVPVSVTADSSPDNYGENRVLSLGIVASVTAVKYCQQSATLCEDAFCESFDCNVNVKSYPAKRIAGTLQECFELSGGISSSGKEISQIIESSATVCSASTEYMEGKAVVNFKLAASILGITPTGEIVFTEGILPLTAVFSESVECSDDNLFFDTSVCVAGMDCKVSAGEIKCDVKVCIRSVVTESMGVNGVSDVEVDMGTPVGRNSNELVIYYPTSSDTLWSVAKKYHVSPEAVKAANKISGNSFDKRTVIIPMK